MQAATSPTNQAGSGAGGAAGPPEAPEYLPISYLNALVYCPRRFYYEYAQGEMLVNEHVLEGRLRHRVADAGGTRTGDGVLSLRRVYVYSERLRISGLIDVVEQPLQTEGGPQTPAPDAGPYPIEYKKGSARGGGLNDHVQLCAQALCLEERLGHAVAGGYVFSFGSMRRTWVPITAELRAQTEEAIQRAFALLAAGRLPPPLPAEEDRKCRACSLEPMCLPREVRTLSVAHSSS